MRTKMSEMFAAAVNILYCKAGEMAAEPRTLRQKNLEQNI